MLLREKIPLNGQFKKKPETLMVITLKVHKKFVKSCSFIFFRHEFLFVRLVENRHNE